MPITLADKVTDEKIRPPSPPAAPSVFVVEFDGATGKRKGEGRKGFKMKGERDKESVG